MSLLMDALKRAETNKQETRPASSSGSSSPGLALSLEDMPTQAAASAPPLPELAVHLDALDAELASASLPTPPQDSPPPGAKSGSEGDRQAAVRNAFAAKQPAAATPSRLTLWLALGTLGLAGLGIGGYVWYQLNAMNRSTLAAAPLARPPAPAATAPLTAPPSVAPLAAVRSMPEETTPAPLPPTVFRPRDETYRAPPVRDSEEIVPPAPIRLSRTPQADDPGILRAHASLERGDLELARRGYEQLLQRDANHVDALLALAAIAQRQGRTADAEQLRQRAVVANPADPAAQAATLSQASADNDPQGTESRLKSLLSAQPESAPLSFALGNLYARQARWPEAQQLYFNAVAADADNPDYLFNLAVSLDHLRQGRLAAQHYRLALEAAARRPAAFDRSRVEQRLAELPSDRPR